MHMSRCTYIYLLTCCLMHSMQRHGRFERRVVLAQKRKVSLHLIIMMIMMHVKNWSHTRIYIYMAQDPDLDNIYMLMICKTRCTCPHQGLRNPAMHDLPSHCLRGGWSIRRDVKEVLGALKM